MRVSVRVRVRVSVRVMVTPTFGPLPDVQVVAAAFYVWDAGKLLGGRVHQPVVHLQGVKRTYWSMSLSLASHWSLSLSLASHWSISKSNGILYFLLYRN